MLKNSLLQQALDSVQESVQDREMFDRLVKAGTKVIYSQGTFQALAKHLKGSEDPVSDVARGMVGVLNLMVHRARGTIPQPALLQAGTALLLDALDFLEQAGMVKVDAETLGRATEEFVEAMLPMLGLSHEKMDQMLGQIKQVMADPQKMAAYQQSQGGAK